MTKPVLHLVVSDVRGEGLGRTAPSEVTPPLAYDAVDFGSGWYHEAAIAASAPPRTAEAMGFPRFAAAKPPAARSGLTLVP